MQIQARQRSGSVPNHRSTHGTNSAPTDLPGRHRSVLAAVVLILTAVVLVPAYSSAGQPATVRPDLVISSVHVGANSVPAGGSTAATVGVANVGHSGSSATSVTVSLSGDKTGRGGTVLANKQAKGLKPGARRRATLSLKVPLSIAAGQYQLRVCLDERKKVKEEKERNNCGYVPLRVTAPTQPTPPPPPPGSGAIAGHLSGKVVLTDASVTVEGTTTRQRQSSAVIDVEMEIAGTEPGEEKYADAGSAYTIATDERAETTAGGCQSNERRIGTGHGGFRYTGDPFTDDIVGGFGRTDHSKFDLGLFMHYSATTVRTGTGPTPPCPNYNETTTVASGDYPTIELTEVSRTSTSITYRPTGFPVGQGGATHWQRAEGTFVLTLRTP